MYSMYVHVLVHDNICMYVYTHTCSMRPWTFDGVFQVRSRYAP